jgi:hypothetical protein
MVGVVHDGFARSGDELTGDDDVVSSSNGDGRRERNIIDDAQSQSVLRDDVESLVPGMRAAADEKRGLVYDRSGDGDIGDPMGGHRGAGRVIGIASEHVCRR